jgi:hypothetical protein
VLGDIDALLRAEGRYTAGRGVYPWRQLVTVLLAGGFLFGAAMGSFGARGLQALYSGVKVPLLIGASTLIALPSFFVINTLLGLRDDFSQALRAVLTAQGTVAVCLTGVATLVAFVYVSGIGYTAAILFNGACFMAAAVAGQITLGRQYRPLIDRDPRHRWGRAAWLTLYAFVAIQMAWTLRPFVGDPQLSTRFLRSSEIGNAYVEVAGLVWRFLQGLTSSGNPY